MRDHGAKNAICRWLALLSVSLIASDILLAAAPAPASHPSPPPYLHTVWTTEQGLPQNSVTSMVQTRDGYLWLATFGGLVRFDGVRFKVFQVGTSRIIALHEDRAGRLWIGTEGSGLFQYANGTFTAATTKQGLPSDRVWVITEDHQGTLWIGTEAGLARHQAGRWITYTTRDGLPDNRIYSIHSDRQGNLWVGTAAELSRGRHGVFSPVKIHGGPPARRVRSMVEDQDGALWVGLPDDGVARFRNNTWTFYPTRGGLFSGGVWPILRDRRGTLWMGTPAGLLRWSDGAEMSAALPPDRRIPQARSFLEDREGNLWIGTDGAGLHRLKKRVVTAYTTDDGLPVDGVVPITSDGQDGLWIGTLGGGLAHYTDGGFTTIGVRQGFPAFYVRSLYQEPSGRLWIGSMGGLYEFDQGQFTVYKGSDGLSHETIHAIHRDRQGRLWIGTAAGLNQFNDGRFIVYRTTDGLVHDDVRFITEDGQGALWIGTMGGMSRFKDGAFTNYTVQDGLSNNSVRAIHQDADGALWIGTYGGGLNRFKDGRFVPVTTENGLFDDVVSRILEDDQGYFWMSGNRGIFRVSRRQLNDFADGRSRSFTCTWYGVADGMIISETNGGSQPAGWKTNDGRLWFPTIKGIVVIDPRSLNPLPPPVVIEQMLIDERPVELREHIEVPPSQGNLEFHYTGLSVVAADKVQFRYQLEGYDRDWVEARTRRVAYYTHLPPGRYRFRVMACNNDGVWNETGTAFEFTLRPHFYQTTWFYGFCVLAVMLAGWSGYKLRVKRLERRTRALETKVAERTAEVVEQKNQLAQANERLEVVNQKLGLANENMLSVLDQLHVGAVVTDPDGRVKFISQFAERLFGQRRDEVLGQPWECLFPLQAEDKRKLTTLYEQPPGPESKLSIHLQTPGDRRYWIEIELLADPRDARQRLFFLYDVSEVYDLRRLLDERARFHDLVGESPSMLLVYQQIHDLAQVDATVLITGETGTGKELAARAIHYASPRKNKPFIAVNCAGLTESLLGSQLFGHKRGAFTGAVADQMGLFEAADGGTVFLDEIGNIPMSVQLSLLRVLQEREITRLGESRPRKIDVRVIAATNRELNQAISEGTFREDLFYRLRVGRIHLPPLRERKQDIPLLVAWFLGQVRASRDQVVQDVSQEAMHTLMAYYWPGNVRELRNAIEWAVIRCKGPIIQASNLPPELGPGQRPPEPPLGGLNPDEKVRILDALERTGGNRKEAARLLGISRVTLYRWMRRLGME